MVILQELTTLWERGVRHEIIQHMAHYIWCYTQHSEYYSSTVQYQLMIISLMILVSLSVGGMLRFLAGKIIPLSRY